MAGDFQEGEAQGDGEGERGREREKHGEREKKKAVEFILHSAIRNAVFSLTDPCLPGNSFVCFQYIGFCKLE